MVIDKWPGLGPDLQQTGRGAQDHAVRTFLAGPDLRLRRVGMIGFGGLSGECPEMLENRGYGPSPELSSKPKHVCSSTFA